MAYDLPATHGSFIQLVLTVSLIAPSSVLSGIQTDARGMAWNSLKIDTSLVLVRILMFPECLFEMLGPLFSLALRLVLTAIFLKVLKGSLLMGLTKSVLDDPLKILF